MENFIKLSKSNIRFNEKNIDRYYPIDTNWTGAKGWYIKIESSSGESTVEYDSEANRNFAISRLDGYFKVTPL